MRPSLWRRTKRRMRLSAPQSRQTMRCPYAPWHGAARGQGVRLRVDFYDTNYDRAYVVGGSRADYERKHWWNTSPIKYFAVWGIERGKPAYAEILRGVSLSSQAPAVIFYCPLYPEHQQHFHHLTRKVFFGSDNILPDWRYADWGVSFDAPSERNFYVPSADMQPAPWRLMQQASAPPLPEDILARKTKFCAFMFENHACATRNHFAEILSRSMRVEAVGRVLRSVRGARPREQPTFREAAMEFYRPFKFVICFENVRTPGYISEKLWTVFSANAVPIYLGDPLIATQYNPDAFIHARDFDSLESLAAHVMRVHEDDALYVRYLSQPRLTEPQRARARAHDVRCLEFLRKALFTPPEGAYVPRAQRDGFLREQISRLASTTSSLLMDAPQLDFRPTRGDTESQMRCIWQGETP